MKLLSRAAIDGILDDFSAIDAIERGFRLHASGAARLAAVGYLGFDQPPGDCHIKSAYIAGDDVFVVKIASTFPRNPDCGLPAGAGMMVVFSAQTGAPLALLQEDGLLTDMRTGLGGAVAAAVIADPAWRAPVLGVVGAGAQARWQARCIAWRIGAGEVLIWARDAAKAASLAADLAGQGLKARAVASAAALAAESQLIVTTTSARAPLLTNAMLPSNARIVAVGADAPGKTEIDPAFLGRADLVIADARAQALDHGECGAAVRAGLLDPARVIDLVAALDAPPALAPHHAAIVDLTGLGVQDVQIAKHALARLAGQAQVTP